MSDNPTPNEPTGDEGKTFSQADVDAAVEKIAAKIRAEERRKVSEKFADYDDLKSKAEGAKTLEDRIAEMETRATKAEIEALRAKHATDVPEKLRPLLTGTTDEELKAQRDLLIDGESERKKKNNVSPREGNNPKSDGSSELGEFTKNLFDRAAAAD
jgi:hypothetical protein